MTDAERDTAMHALSEYRGARFAELVTVIIGLAAQEYPEEVRKALESVFDLSAIEEMTKRMVNVVNEVQKSVIEFRDKTRADLLELVGVIHKMVDTLDKRIDFAENNVSLLEHRITKAAAIVKGLNGVSK